MRRGLGAVLLSLALALGSAASASAYTYDYQMDTPPGGGWSRGVAHDYRYLRGTLLGYTTCVERTNNGQWFCGLGQGEHHYVDGCNPATCWSFYKFSSSNASTQIIYIHEEWV